MGKYRVSMFKKILALLTVAGCAAAHAEEQYLGLYMGGSRIGYSVYSSRPETLNSATVTRSDSKTVMNAGLLGAAMSVTIQGTTWTDAKGKPLKLTFTMTSGGRTQQVDAVFKEKTAEIDIQNGGQKTHKSVPIPAGATIVDDPLSLVVSGSVTPGSKKTIYVLDPTTVSFMKTDIVLVGPKEVTVSGTKTTATLVQVVDPRITTDVYLTSKGDFVKAEAMGIEMIPETREKALDSEPAKYQPTADLAFATSIKTDRKIASPEKLTNLKIRVTGKDLSSIPSDGFQTVKKEGGSWIVEVHPAKLDPKGATTIQKAGAQKPAWTKPSLNMPCASTDFKKLAKQIVKGEKRVVPAALSIQDYVYKTMKPNAGIGVLRDATEVLETKEGVCRDYAVLTATLMRSAGIPARLASGIVNWQGDFFYHAWVEVWDGSKWIGIDSTVPQHQISAAHVKLADGNVEEAFAFTFLDKVKIEVLDARRN